MPPEHATRLERLKVVASQLGSGSLKEVAGVRTLRELQLNAIVSAADLGLLDGHPALEVLRGNRALPTSGHREVDRLSVGGGGQ